MVLTCAQQGLGGVGRLQPTNFVADAQYEAHFTKFDSANGQPTPGSASNRERRWYYFGPDVGASSVPRNTSSQFSLSPRRDASMTG